MPRLRVGGSAGWRPRSAGDESDGSDKSEARHGAQVCKLQRVLLGGNLHPELRCRGNGEFKVEFYSRPKHFFTAEIMRREASLSVRSKSIMAATYSSLFRSPHNAATLEDDSIDF